MGGTAYRLAVWLGVCDLSQICRWPNQHKKTEAQVREVGGDAVLQRKVKKKKKRKRSREEVKKCYTTHTETETETQTQTQTQTERVESKVK